MRGISLRASGCVPGSCGELTISLPGGKPSRAGVMPLVCGVHGRGAVPAAHPPQPPAARSLRLADAESAKRALHQLKKKWGAYLTLLTGVTRSKLNKVERNKVRPDALPAACLPLIACRLDALCLAAPCLPLSACAVLCADAPCLLDIRTGGGPHHCGGPRPRCH